MALGTVVRVDADGGGMIVPDSNGEPISYTSDSVIGDVKAGDRVQFRARVTGAGVFAYALQAQPPIA